MNYCNVICVVLTQTASKKFVRTLCFAPTDGADVGVIVTDGVIVKFEPVRDWPYGDRCDGGAPAVNVAPPGRDERVGCGITFKLVRPPPIGPLGCWRISELTERLDDFDCCITDGGGAGVTLREPFVNAAGISISGFGVFEAFVCVTIKFSLSTDCVCFNFFSRTNFVSSLRSSSRNFRSPRSRSHISAADSSLIAIIGGISSSSVSESMFPFCWRPFTFAGNKTMSGASAYDFGSVRGRNTRLLLA